ncbi:hypothetical protein ElyMa_002460700 [Elysia marginata]|uniref:ZP domain-containing protein n=1 Tax=Elysia marginata TaxID=1093978 RepID=A0AAV4GLI6_9GAST|nr:hypothetical protein ElyMa_002460700 [Elysia marginata]
MGELVIYFTFSMFCRALGSALKVTSVGRRLASDDTNEADQDRYDLRHKLECHATHMFVHIPSALAPNSKMYMRDSGCELTNNGSHFVITLAYDSCGTALTFYQDFMFAANDVIVHLDIDTSAPIQFDKDYTIHLECKVPRNHKVEGAFVVSCKSYILFRMGPGFTKLVFPKL